MHAAEGYARATGKVGVCLATSGPGATNLVTGIADAYLDSIPIVAITGQVKADLIGTDAFQEADTTGITLPIVKHSYLVQNGADLPQIIHEAFHIASTGRPGPVLIDIPGRPVPWPSSPTRRPAAVDLPGYKPTDARPHQAGARRRQGDDRGAASGPLRRAAASSRRAPPTRSASWPRSCRSRSPPRSWRWAPSPRRTSSRWACSACTAPPTPTRRCTSATC